MFTRAGGLRKHIALCRLASEAGGAYSEAKRAEWPSHVAATSETAAALQSPSLEAAHGGTEFGVNAEAPNAMFPRRWVDGSATSVTRAGCHGDDCDGSSHVLFYWHR